LRQRHTNRSELGEKKSVSSGAPVSINRVSMHAPLFLPSVNAATITVSSLNLHG
jgi:hypothetical protein